ncbi:MAG: hypothetical protein ACTHMJ_12955 [Thermomicrobiales bacterium]|nr:hypothetical protein [Thermomicrobiales bacterium]
MRRIDSRALWGTVLIIGGGVLLLLNTGVITFAEWVWAGIFSIAGGVFLAYFLYNRRQWGALLPASTLLGIGVVLGLAALGGEYVQWGGSAFLALLGAGFAAVYFDRRERWWAIVPAGALFTLALVAAVGPTGQASLAGSLLFYGLALTFGVVYLVPAPQGRRQWALFPAAACLLLGTLVLGTLGPAAGYVWSLALIAVGAYLLYRNRFSARR